MRRPVSAGDSVGRMHDLGAGVLTLALFAGATITARRRPEVAAPIIVQVSLLAVGPSVPACGRAVGSYLLLYGRSCTYESPLNL